MTPFLNKTSQHDFVLERYFVENVKRKIERKMHGSELVFKRINIEWKQVLTFPSENMTKNAVCTNKIH